MQVPSYYEFCCRVKTVSGHNALEKIPSFLDKLDAKAPMIITDKGVTGAGLITIVEEAIKGSGVEIKAVCDDVPPDSDLKVVNELAKVYQEKGCDSIIAVGGGSPIDTAKGVNIVVSENATDLMQFAGVGVIKKRLKPMIAIPTTSGTGSEMTLVAVIADHEKNVKMAFVSYFLLPDFAILDSRMTKTLPPFITAPTAMDAMTHAIEAYTCLGKNPVSDATALKAIEMISLNLLKVVKKPDDLDGRLALANASALAGMSFSNSMVGMVHTLGHATGGVCHVPHGVCMSIFLPYALEYNMHKIKNDLAEVYFALAGQEEYAKTAPGERAEKAITFVRQLNQDLHDATDGKHARCLKEVFDREGNPMVPKDKLSDIVKTALGDASQFYNPEDFDYNDLMFVIEHAWEGTPLDRSKIKKG